VARRAEHGVRGIASERRTRAKRPGEPPHLAHDDLSARAQGTPRIGLREGDFAGAISLDGIRECLGSDWTETHASAQYQSYGDAWVFARSGQPLVLYVQSRSDQYRRVEMKIIIERAE
jgi:hypothetical protein